MLPGADRSFLSAFPCPQYPQASENSTVSLVPQTVPNKHLLLSLLGRAGVFRGDMQLETAAHLDWLLCMGLRRSVTSHSSQMLYLIKRGRHSALPHCRCLGDFIHSFLFILTYELCRAEPIPLRLSGT